MAGGERENVSSHTSVANNGRSFCVHTGRRVCGFEDRVGLGKGRGVPAGGEIPFGPFHRAGD